MTISLLVNKMAPIYFYSLGTRGIARFLWNNLGNLMCLVRLGVTFPRLESSGMAITPYDEKWRKVQDLNLWNCYVQRFSKPSH